MHRLQHIEALSRRLQQADAAADWSTLRQVDREIAASGARWTRHGLWTDTDRAALRRLQQLHAHACSHCAGEAERMEAALHNMLATKEGWLAYAVAGEWQGALE